MSTIQDLHRQAMDLAEQADLAKMQGDIDSSKGWLRQALELESKAASIVSNDLSAEPTRSVLYRSAASLAIECGELASAEKLIATALAGAPPTEIAEELKDLFININLPNYLNRQGIKLTEKQLQSLAR